MLEYPINYDSPLELKSFLEARSLSMKKRFGQNFLVNRGAREKITDCLSSDTGNRVWEIGPGLGALTWHLLERGASVTAFEIDHGFAECLKDFYGDLKNFRIIEGDFLKLIKRIESGAMPGDLEKPDIILGNLPYVTGSVMTASIIRSELKPRKMVFTVQKEVGRRMAAKIGDPDYSGFSLVCQSEYNVFLRGDLKPGSFYPSPRIQSSIVELGPHEKFNFEDKQLYYQLIEDLFRSRRKKISNNLANGVVAGMLDSKAVKTVFADSGISGDRRAETLSVSEVEKLSGIILKIQNNS